MITHSDAEQQIERWLAATAPVGSADRVLAETFNPTRGMVRRSGSPQRSVSIRRRPIAFAVVAAVILVAVSFGIRRTGLAQAAPLGSIDGQRWVDSNEVAVTIQRDPSDDREFYWRAVAYDQIDKVGVSIGHPMTTARPPATSLLAGMAAISTRRGRTASRSRSAPCRSPARWCCPPRRRSWSIATSG